MGGDHVGDSVEEPADVTSEVCVPRVRVQEIRPGCVTCHFQVNSDGLEGKIRTDHL